MSVERDDPAGGAPDGADALLRRAAKADARAARRLVAAATELATPDDARLDDELRAAIAAMLARLVEAIEADLRHYAGRAAVLASSAAPSADRLVRAGLFDDSALVAELVARALGDLIAARLPASPSDDAERPSLLPRLASAPDRVVANAANALMAAEARRRGPGPDTGRDDLAAELHHRLVWWVAAGLRPERASAAVDAALTDAARRVLAAHDEGARIEAAAQRLAAALDPAEDAIGAMIEEALADRRVALAVALLAHGLAIEPALSREILLDPDADRLLLALRALDVPHETIAAIGLALCEADRRRDPEVLVASLDAVMAMPVEIARDAVARLRLPADYRAALRALELAR